MCNILFGIGEQYFYFDRSSIVSKCFPPWSSDSKVDSIHASVCSPPHPHTQRCTGRAEPVFPGLLSFAWVYLLNHATCRMFQSSAAFSGDNRKLQSLLLCLRSISSMWILGLQRHPVVIKKVTVGQCLLLCVLHWMTNCCSFHSVTVQTTDVF